MSTLHTNSAAGAITRLRDMGLESFLIGSSLLGVIAQRLVRRLCTHCRTTSPLDANEKALFSFMAAPPDAIYRAVGCEHCRQSGYQGRAGIHEFWWWTAPCAAPSMKIRTKCPSKRSF